MDTNYSMVIEYSIGDNIFVVSIPEFEGLVSMPCTYGNTREDAVKAGLEVIETFLEIWKEEGKSIPQPATRKF